MFLDSELKVYKLKDEWKAYLVTVFLGQCAKVLLYQVSFHRVIIQPKIASKESYTKKEIQKKNCLTLIIKNYNIAHLVSSVILNLKLMLGDKNVINTYFPWGDPISDKHARICNLEVLNPTIYKQYIKRTSNSSICMPNTHCTFIALIVRAIQMRRS